MFPVIALALAFAAPAAGQSGPGVWEIVGVGGALRRVPVDGGGVIARPEAGSLVKNLGCQNSRGRRWCQVELMDQPGVSGWIGNNNLRAAAPAVTPAPASATGKPPLPAAPGSANTDDKGA